MKGLIILFAVMGLVLVGCSQDAVNSYGKKDDSTKQQVYSNSWDGNPIIVKQRNHNGDYETVNEITDIDEVDELIRTLGNADWQENVKMDIRPPDYRFSWNSYKHDVWINKNNDRLGLSIEGQSNYGSLSADSSTIVFEIITGEKLEDPRN